ncbi:hypothetical protein BSKO_01258 [Bryopsis sp. KO-2023]|nr:hypothetical protein BSKO_01258 [Bryopsis sp. KO-2023]
MNALTCPRCVAYGISSGMASRLASSRAASSLSAARTSVIRDIQRDLRSKEKSAVEITKDWLEKLKSREAKVDSFISVTEESALAQAASVDAALGNGGAESLGPLAGVPIAIKDNICTKGIVTTAGSKVLHNYVPPYDAFVTEKLHSSGAVMLGKTNLDEFGMGSSTEKSAFKVTRNPWSLDRVPGGSSGGSAAAVAAGQCVASLGSDTGGSIRQPAHFCGIVGIKPTYGRVSRYGLIAYGSSFDCIGPMATTVEDAALMLNSIAGLDKRDATSSELEVPDFAANLKPADELESRPLEGKRLGIISETLGEGVDSAVVDGIKKATQHLESLGAQVDEISLQSFTIGLPAYYVLAVSEASSNLSRYDGVRYGLRESADDLREMYGSTRMAGLGDEVKRRIIMGTYALSAGYYDAYYKRAQQVRTLVRNELCQGLESYDALITPTAPSLAFKFGEVSDPLTMYKGDLMLVGCNLAGLPSLVVPCGVVERDGQKLPLGMQLIGKSFGEKDIIDVAHIFEQTADFAGGEPVL